MIRAVTFDVGGTLIEPWPSVGHIYAEVAAENGITGLSPEELSHRFGEAWSKIKPQRYSRDEWAALVDATFAGLTPEPPSRTFFPALYDRFNEPRCWRVFDDVLPALITLKMSGLRLAMISNWDERLRPLLARLELLPCFEECLISCEAGAAKPDRRIFLAAAERLKLKPNEVLHVGDSQREDMAGALAAGFHALLIDRSQPASAGRLSDLRQAAAHQMLLRTDRVTLPPAR
jgi:putative hydrolase of the HAD superfamily